jgi:hypothetical protein
VRDLDRTALTELDWTDLTATARRALAAMDLVSDLRVDYLPRAGYDLLRLHVLQAVLGLRSLSGQLTLGTRTRTEDANRGLEGWPSRSGTTPCCTTRSPSSTGRRCSSGSPAIPHSRRSARRCGSSSPSTDIARPPARC